MEEININKRNLSLIEKLIDVWSPVNKIDNLNRDFFVLCHD